MLIFLLDILFYDTVRKEGFFPGVTLQNTWPPAAVCSSTCQSYIGHRPPFSFCNKEVLLPNVTKHTYFGFVSAYVGKCC